CPISISSPQWFLRCHFRLPRRWFPIDNKGMTVPSNTDILDTWEAAEELVDIKRFLNKPGPWTKLKDIKEKAQKKPTAGSDPVSFQRNMTVIPKSITPLCSKENFKQIQVSASQHCLTNLSAHERNCSPVSLLLDLC
uniref:Uncharacterized protein n=1 Tax=Crocodylus porosus TaxID=8502 RepID=A0A7M4E8W7_CROPO